MANNGSKEEEEGEHANLVKPTGMSSSRDKVVLGESSAAARSKRETRAGNTSRDEDVATIKEKTWHLTQNRHTRRRSKP